MNICQKCEWFTITAQPRTRQVRIALAGVWDEAALQSFERALGDTIARLIAAGAPYGTYRSIVDLREQGILTQLMAKLASGLASGPGEASERIAVVVANTLQKLQQARISPVGNLKVFLDYAEAEAWVLSDS